MGAQNQIIQQPQTDTQPGHLHQRPALLPIDTGTPRVFKILKARAKAQELLATGQLSRNDSIKLNIIELYGGENEFFQDNVLTRILHPIDTANVVNSLRKIETAPNINDSASLVLNDTTGFVFDSITAAKPVVTHNEKVEFLQHKEFSPVGFQAQTTWLLPMVLLLVLFAGLLRAFSGKYIANLFKSVFNNQNAENLYNTINIRNSLPSFGLDVLFVLNMGLFAFLTLNFAGFTISSVHPVLLYVMVCLVLTILIVVKTAIYKFLGYVFNTKEQTGEFLFYVFLYTRVVALALLPITISLPFIDVSLAAYIIEGGLVLFVAMYIVQLMRGLKIFLRNPAAIFYMFLYLCALEILPFLVIYRLLNI